MMTGAAFAMTTMRVWLAIALGACRSAAPAPAATAPVACDLTGTWEVTVDGDGCPVGSRTVKLVDGVGVDAAQPAMS